MLVSGTFQVILQMSWHFRGRPLNSGLSPPRLEVQTKVGVRVGSQKSVLSAVGGGGAKSEPTFLD